MTSSTKTKTSKAKTTTKATVSASTKLPPNPFMFEILELASKQRTNQKKVEVLQEYSTDALKAILIWNYDDSVISMIPSGDVPYEKNDVPVGTDHTSLRKEWKNLYHFVKGGNDSLSQVRRETMFIQILEGLHPKEADVLCLVKDKNLESVFKIGKAVVEQAFPDIQWGGRS